MVVITSKQENKVFGFGNQLEYLPNGYPVIVDKGVGFALSDIHISEDVHSVPEGVLIGKYLYTPKEGFYIDPNYTEPDQNPWGLPPELVDEIQTDYREKLAKEVSENGYNA